MKVYIFLQSQDLVLFNGLLADPERFIGHSEAALPYWEKQQEGCLMVSINIDTFIFMQDNGLLYLNQLIIN